jgi:hypothetical protein
MSDLVRERAYPTPSERAALKAVLGQDYFADELIPETGSAQR